MREEWEGLKGNSPVLNIRVPSEVVQQLDDMADLMGVDRTRVAQACLASGLEDAEKLVRLSQRDMSALLLLVGARAVGGREGFAKVREFVRRARGGGQPVLPFVESRGGRS